MKWLSADLTFVNLSTVCGLLLGLAGNGLSTINAIFSLVAGAAFAVAAYLGTSDTPWPRRKAAGEPASSPAMRYRRFWLWIIAACFVAFAVRSFCWLLYVDENEWRIQSPNNLGDLALHITLIRNFANGVPLWPDNPIYVASKLRYPAGMDLFNALLYLVRIDLKQGLVWAGLAASVATFYAFYRWAGAFGIAGFLFNGGTAGFQVFKTLKFLDYQGDKTIAWKSIALTMFVTQRGLLYAIPACLLMLWYWRDKFFHKNEQDRHLGSLPFWVELSLYASMPLFHMHTFLALSAVLVCLFVCGDSAIRKHVATLTAAAFLPAAFFVWMVSDNFRAGTILRPHLGWVMSDPGFGRSNLFRFWFENFGIFIPLAFCLLTICAWRVWKANFKLNQKLAGQISFLLPAFGIFVSGLLFRFAPWDWDNLKLMIWAYFLVLPFLWNDLIARWSLPIRILVCLALFGSGFVSIFGGLAAGRPGFGLIDRAELDAVGAAVRTLPVEARFAAYPTYNHPLLLQGRKVVMGYSGHLWTEGFDDYPETENRLRNMMEGTADWRDIARSLAVRYIFWGREETANYKGSKRPWETTVPMVASGSWGTIYDLGS